MTTHPVMSARKREQFVEDLVANWPALRDEQAQKMVDLFEPVPDKFADAVEEAMRCK